MYITSTDKKVNAVDNYTRMYFIFKVGYNNNVTRTTRMFRV
jgi:hypothetical protein